MISAPALAKRYGCQMSELAKIPNEDKIWTYSCEYAAQITSSVSLCYSLDAFIIGGGIVSAKGREFLLKNIQKRTRELLNGYIKTPRIEKSIYGADSGLIGATAVALYPEAFQVK
ncbi:RO-related protein [Trichomonas vaginalis G3]|uniref:RO-related protein n=1 Tax=Trichomonas vaginalis (strain ATCC PRA-98 / G3) TaxID=412133 RepID=A2G429_TRIV3|nr:ROK family [Trichomonas vaginalis G3]EAX88094.1 RO-related protein [Trichomonas vaginalis G3]KAI5495774.1 ROK family [Trichomonas vaginalis G3]|eukprot:XP_001301024.1 RO-related protein [Trichomonas vaginalis G3]